MAGDCLAHRKREPPAAAGAKALDQAVPHGRLVTLRQRLHPCFATAAATVNRPAAARLLRCRCCSRLPRPGAAHKGAARVLRLGAERAGAAAFLCHRGFKGDAARRGGGSAAASGAEKAGALVLLLLLPLVAAGGGGARRVPNAVCLKRCKLDLLESRVWGGAGRRRRSRLRRLVGYLLLLLLRVTRARH